MAAGNQAGSPQKEYQGHCSDNTKGDSKGKVSDAEQGVAEAVDQVKKRVQVR